ncbi:AEC family transporter [Clostridium sp.]|uniref:AEC family transporter n=1 Tax=Clostridium sp. TaxID=1506 RepID=UPI00262D6621|nr:AEC family transporter [uncultured Clostridium sp.]
MDIFIYILTKNILPLVLIIIIGFLLSKKFNLDINTLSKINFYVYVPFFIFMQIYSTKLPKQVLKILVFVVILAIVNSIITTIISKVRRYDEGFKNAFTNSIMFYNSGNIGIPLITLIFSSGPFLINGKTPYLAVALTTQIVVLIVQNISTNTIGFFNAGKGNMTWQDSVKSILQMPTIYMIPLAFILKALPFRLENMAIWPGLVYIQNGLISFALITLGAQLSKTKLSFTNVDVYISNVTRLLGGPIIAFLILKVIGITGVTAQTLVISSAIPTAVNTALIAVERNNHADFASLAVMTSTLLSSITLVFVVFVSRLLFPL